MNRSGVVIQIDEPRRAFSSGQMLAGHWRTEGVRGDEVTAFEISVVWHTEGKGNEDFGVHFFQRETAEVDRGFDGRSFRRFETALPNSPLSYDGLIITIHWCVRVRVFLSQGRELVGEHSFRLGNVPSAAEVSS